MVFLDGLLLKPRDWRSDPAPPSVHLFLISAISVPTAAFCYSPCSMRLHRILMVRRKRRSAPTFSRHMG